VTVAGTNITARLLPVLHQLTVTDNVGTHSDTANLEIDDTKGRIVFPQKGAPVTIALGWQDGGVRVVFIGTVDEVTSKGSRSSGRVISVTAKGMDTTKKPKQNQQRHFDDKTVKDILTEAGNAAGVRQVNVDPRLANLRRVYFDMRDESFIHVGERLAREVGGNFRVQGNTATLSKRGGGYTSFIRAVWGDNLQSWDIAPDLGRTQFSEVRARWYDKKAGKWKEAREKTGNSVDARHDHRHPKADENEAKQQIGSDKATTERDKAQGSVTIEGNSGAILDGLCIIAGARAGVDGSYRIESVTHTYSRGGGFVTSLNLKAA